ncbi:flavonol synthase/flavanone 3-hydroxylase [Viridothelium virens]|uniref:Flavonol synthase/flavanone 3-hydroxylase n=1 Tax=Viridothelium virens TaxID=1048519 RepID=A0A6A6HN54_VIRVR|nr:flavonol synthase/flavanone 3-hydroxylase [Viridothelium virens]
MATLASDSDQFSVPVIDFHSFLNGTDDQKKSTAAQIKDTFQNVGFVYLINHGVPGKKVEECFEWSKKFFNLPSETKMLAPHPPGASHHRGYSGIGRERVSQNVFDRDAIEELRRVPDNKESFESGNVEDGIQPNIWLPEDKLPGFRGFMEDFFVECAALIRHVFGAIALGFSLPPTFFQPFHSRELYQLRLLHYPPISEHALLSGEKGRLDAHSDFGTLTLLFQDDVGGLEVERPKDAGKFMPVRPIEGAVLINIADCLMRWSNDSLKSTVHRVVAPPIMPEDTSEHGEGDKMTSARYSIVCFAAANPDVVVDALPGTWGEQKPKKYEPITAGEYILKRMEATY